VQQRALVAGLKHLPALMLSILGTLPAAEAESGSASVKVKSLKRSGQSPGRAGDAAPPGTIEQGPLLDVTQFSGWDR